MRKLVLLSVLMPAFLHGQYRELLRPEATHLTCIVVDREGMAIPGVHVDHHGNLRQTVATDANGRFDVKTKAPAIVLRKEGYRSQFIRTSETVLAQIALDRMELAQAPKSCTASSRCESIDGWAATFCFPHIAGVQASNQGHDIDYGIRTYAISSARGPAAIMHGSGPMWTFGIPTDTDVWRSVTYEEVIYSANKLIILDARGRTVDGKYWRYVGKFGESASYRDISEGAARLLDRVLDGMCIRQ